MSAKGKKNKIPNEVKIPKFSSKQLQELEKKAKAKG